MQESPAPMGKPVTPDALRVVVVRATGSAVHRFGNDRKAIDKLAELVYDKVPFKVSYE